MSGFTTDKMPKKEVTYFVDGMHCASCELLIEKKLLREEGVAAVEASAGKGEARLVYEGKKPNIERLNKIFARDGYTFSTQPPKIQDKDPFQKTFYLVLNFCLAALLILGFIVLTQSGLAAKFVVTSASALPTFFFFGLLAGVSSCAALIGGIVLSMSKQWSGGVRPHLLFNLGRLLSFAAFGALIGALGSFLQISLTATAALTIAVSLLMVFLSLQMLGFKNFRRLQLTVPKFATRYIANESNFKGRYLPFLLGALTFFLPCGFTLTTQGLALTSGNPLQGGLMMLFFALGTLPTLLFIGLSSTKFSQKPHLSAHFSRIAGLLVLFFAVYNINAQLNLLGLKSLSDSNVGTAPTAAVAKDGVAPLVNGKQVLKMDAFSYAYKPNYFRVKASIPVRWEITDKGVSGCTNAVISKGLFEGRIDLGGGRTSIKEFTPQRTGRYKFSCWMGMVSGIIDVY